MTSEDSLLFAVLADPEDEQARLVYADWLEERGDADRTEFLRLLTETVRRFSGRPDILYLNPRLHHLWRFSVPKGWAYLVSQCPPVSGLAEGWALAELQGALWAFEEVNAKCDYQYSFQVNLLRMPG